LKRITILLPISCLVLLSAIAATGTIISQAAFAHTDKYYIGYSQGQTQARTDYYAYAQDYRPFCPVYDKWTEANGPHSSNFCAGFIDGYNAEWNSLPAYHNQRVQQTTDQSSSVNIKGNNNRVTVNQQTNNNVGGQNSGYGHSHYGHGSGILPRCFILCSNIEVR
jgi:hypothetical protein